MERLKICPEEARALSSERRLRILLLIHEGFETHGTLSRELDIAEPSLSRQIQILTRTGLISVNRERNSNHKVQNRYTLTDRGERLLAHIDLEPDESPTSETPVLGATL